MGIKILLSLPGPVSRFCLELAVAVDCFCRLMGWVGAAHRNPSKRSVFQRGELLPVKSEREAVTKKTITSLKNAFFLVFEVF